MLAFVFPAFDPVALRLGDTLAVRWYGLAYVAGILLALWYTHFLVKRAAQQNAHHPITLRDLSDFVTWAVIAIVLGGRLGYVVMYQRPFNLGDAFAIWRGGMSFHGGCLGVIIAAWIFARRRHQPPLALLDLLACAAPIGLFLGRIANFINGELFGRVTTVSWGMIFPNGGLFPRHPSQIYEACLEGIVLFVILAILVQRPSIRARTGLLSGVFLVGYAIARLAVECVREPDAQIGFLPLGMTMGQVLSVPMLVVGNVLILRSFHSPSVRKSGASL